MALNFEVYLKSIQSDLRRGNATEYTYRSALESLIESAGKGINASNDPKHIECGAPDFIVERRKVPLGYIETKDVGADLDRVEKSEQMKRYLKALHNLILTDYLEFRWYVNGEKRLTTHLAARTGNDQLKLNPLGAQVLEEMLTGFLATETPTVNTPKELAERLAAVTHFIRGQIVNALESGDEEMKRSLADQYRVFTDLLLPALKPNEFADLYAQTVTYGLFAARVTALKGDPFTLEDAYKYLRRIPFLRTLFLNVNEQLDEIDIIRPYLQDIVSLLNRTNIEEILADFGKRTRTEDPIVHFYETFLAKYDPKLRESRGVYYTPEPVVQFIVRSVDEILKTRFNKPWGLADDSVKVLDPAAGTGTFLYYVIQRVHDEIVNVRGQGGQWAEKSRQLLNRLFGFELLIPPYTISHLKLGLLMDQLGSPLEGKEDRVHVYLTNTLEEGVKSEGMLPGLGHGIAKESSEAAKVKQADDIMVVLGNPPYSGHSANASKDKDGNLNFIGKLVRDYYFVDGQPLGERNPKWLQDDYVKFIRYGEWRINKTGQGVLAFITNHGYLDNPTFRGMRQHLMQTFDEIYVLDLHGNSKKKETAPDGSKDENVFDIQQGVAVFIGVKNPSISSKIICHSDYWGTRANKYCLLNQEAFSKSNWTKITPEKPFYLFMPQQEMLTNEYSKYLKINEIIPENLMGFQTHRDEIAVGWDEDILYSQIIDFLHKTPSKDVWSKNKSECLYRPFDNRYVYLAESVTDRPRLNIMNHLLYPNFAFAIGKQGLATGDDEWNIVFCSSKPVDANVYRRGGANIFPLYLYTTPELTKGTLFYQEVPNREPNISNIFLSDINNVLGFLISKDQPGDLINTCGPEDIFHYIYAILHSPTYRTRYAEFLKIDFPRIPLTSDKALFAALVGKGKELVDLHLLKSPKVENFITTYQVSGDNLVGKVRCEGDKVWINPAQYFGGVPEQVWNFRIGGYQVCDKWLKDRKGRVLSSEDISHYQRVVVALNETIRLMREIDETIPRWPIE